ncbi:MAG: SapC family protein [Rhizomicrobium sp.]
MTNVVILNSQLHRTLRVQAGASARFGDDRRFVQVIANEFPLLAIHYPVFFAKDADTGAFYCGAMLGFDEGENLFLEEGRPQSAYRPLNLQRGPFYTAGNELAVDLDSPRMDGEAGEALFTPAGEPTAYLESIKAAMRELRDGLERTKIFIDTLMTLKLIEPVNIKVGFDDGTKRDVVGLYTISQDALRGLPDADVLELFRRGYLHLIYLMIASLKQVPVLAQKKNRRILAQSESLGLARL